MSQQRLLAVVTTALIAVVVAASLAWYYLRPSHRLQAASQAPTIAKATAGQPAPQFVVSTTQGPFDLDASTKPVFVEIFATWCPHCQRETAVIDKLYAEYKSRVNFVGVSGSDTAMDHISPASQFDVVQWAQQFHVQYPVAFDSTESVADLYLQGGFPTIAVIGKDKRIAYIDSGEISYDDLRKAIEGVL